MISVSILYPNKEGGTFDFHYYTNVHMPMAREKLGPTLKGVTVARGLSGGLPDSSAPYTVITRLMFESATAFYAAFLPCAEELRNDIPNYTNVSPVIQISELIAQ